MEEYYINQAGTGYSFYSGNRYQRGHNWFGRLFKSSLLPLLKYVGKKAFNTGKNVVRDMAMGDDFKTSAKKHIKNTIHDVTDNVIDKVTQSGSGKRKRKRKTLKPVKRRKTIHKKVKVVRRKRGRPRKKRRTKKKAKVTLPWE